MKNTIYFLLFVLICGCSSTPTNDYRKTLETLKVKNQIRLDKGEGMMIVEHDYRVTMDSMLNVVYDNLMLELNESEKNILREEQRQWITNRNIEFERLWELLKESEEGNVFGGQDARKIVYSQEAEFIKRRVLELVDEFDMKQ